MRYWSTLLWIAAVAMTWPQVAASQSPQPVVGFLTGLAESDRPYLEPAVVRGLEDAGYVEGEDVKVEFRWAAGDFDQLDALARELVDLDAAVIITDGTASTKAAQAVAGTTPLVFLTGSDPVKRGFVESLNRPGGNLTGFLLINTDIAAKRTAMLLELFPAAKEIVLLANPSNPASATHEAEFRKVAEASGREVGVLEAADNAEIDAAFESLGDREGLAMVVQADQFLDSRRQRLLDLAFRHRVATIYQWREYVLAGGLASYGVSITRAYRALGELAGLILNGRSPADLPVRRAHEFELVVNLDRARTLGIDVPTAILLQADEVIE